MNLAQFNAQFPEFETYENTLIQTMLDAAATIVSANVFGTQFDLAHGLKTAHLLMISPFGQSGRLKTQADEDGALLTTYEGQFKKIARAAACGLSRVT